MSTPTLDELEELARQAGQILRQSYEPLPGAINHLQIDYKGPIDLVTDVDRRSENFLLRQIRDSYPGHCVIAEESGALQGDPDHIWYIDPLDGTVNYAHGIPFFSVSIAYQEQGELVLGAVYDPLRDECFTAETAKGARLNGTPIRPSSATDLGHCLLTTGFPYNIRTNPNNNLDHYARLSLRTQGVRRLGSAALDCCYVACGRFDGYWENEVAPYDIAAGGLIARQAGAIVTNISGETDFLAPPITILVAPPPIHAQLSDYFRQYYQR